MRGEIWFEPRFLRRAYLCRIDDFRLTILDWQVVARRCLVKFPPCLQAAC